MLFVGDDITALDGIKKAPWAIFKSGFSSLAQFTAQASVVSPDCWRAPFTRGGEEWCGTKDMDHAVRLACRGWQEGAERAQTIIDRVNVSAPQRRALRGYGVAGATPDVPRMLSGNPLHMRAFKARPAQKIITLYSGVFAPCFVPAERLLARAACAAAIIDRLEDAGFSCEVIALGQGKDAKGGYQVAVRLKNAGEPLDISTLAFGLGHSSMLRRLTFQHVANHPATKPIGEGMGCAQELELHDGFYSFVGFTPATARLMTNEENTLEYLLSCLREQGCPGLE